MKWLKPALVWGGGIVLANVVVVAVFVGLSEPDPVAEFETAAGTPDAPAAGGFVQLPPFAVQVRIDPSETTVDYLTLRLALAQPRHRSPVCLRMPQIADTLNMTIGRQALSPHEWQQITSAASAETLRRHFNRAMNADYIETVTIRRGRQPASPEGSCER